jgi:hypothetical protein
MSRHSAILALSALQAARLAGERELYLHLRVQVRPLLLAALLAEGLMCASQLIGGPGRSSAAAHLDLHPLGCVRISLLSSNARRMVTERV